MILQTREDKTQQKSKDRNAMDMLDNIREDDMKETISSLTSTHAFLPDTQLLRAHNHLRVSKGTVVYDIANKRRHDTTERKDGNAMDMLDNIREGDMKEMVSTLRERDAH
ncbi:hypothetical protein Tco_1164904 [Tanacetum coccineum]